MKSKGIRRRSSTMTKRAIRSSSYTEPTTLQIKKLVEGENLSVKDSRCIKKLKDVYRTLMIRIIRAAGSRKEKNRTVTMDDLIYALTSLFGTKIQTKLGDGTVVVDVPRFRKMFKECLEILASKDLKVSNEVMAVIHKATEVCLAKAFLSPLSAWQLEKKGMDADRVLTMEDLLAVNQVHLLSESEFFSPSLVKSE